MTASTVSLPATDRTYKQARKLSNAGLCCQTFTQAIATTSIDEQDDTVELGYVPEGVTVVGFFVKATDMDTGTAALVFKLTLGSTDLATLIDDGKTGTGKFYACTPTTTTARTLLKMIVTTAANVAAAGTLYVTPVYYSAS
jgi:Cdc6-like AAA superfamily ATPase